MKVGKLFLIEKNYIERVLERLGIKSARPVSTPLAIFISSFQLSYLPRLIRGLKK